MPLGKNVSANIEELYKDNKKSGKARGANGKPRSRKQIIAIAMHAAGKSKSPGRKVGGMGVMKKVLGGRMG
jgi:hypothetical protein